MKALKVYIAGKVSKESVFGTHDWRDGFCTELERLSGAKIKNIDPTKTKGDFDLGQDAKLVYGRNAFMISLADFVIVNLTDDISVGGSQEMLIARYFGKPLIGIAPLDGKFRKLSKEVFGRVYSDWTDPIVKYTCDYLVEDIPGAAEILKHGTPGSEVKSVDELIDSAVNYYKNKAYSQDLYLH